VLVGAAGWFALIMTSLIISSVTTFDIDAILEFAVSILRSYFALCLLGMGVGLWRTMEPDPFSEPESRTVRAVLRTSGALVIPAFGLMLGVGHVTGLVAVQQAIAQLCFVIITIHIVAMVRAADDLEGRCVTRHNRWRRAGRIPTAVVLAIAFLGLYWWGVKRSGPSGPCVLPTAQSARSFAMALGILWFVVASRFRLTLVAVRMEIAPVPAHVDASANASW
jgi:hypothetical protein